MGLPSPQASTGEVLTRAMTVQGHCPRDLKEGQVGYWSPSPMYTFTKSPLFPH